mmetsp:Transcript_23727/g.58666  ORF Transcript_23727/g.58666 Transcript_23727/m.58666 type:complete len:218 (-) Transcript_23727:624-1277(-)
MKSPLKGSSMPTCQSSTRVMPRHTILSISSLPRPSRLPDSAPATRKDLRPTSASALASDAKALTVTGGEEGSGWSAGGGSEGRDPTESRRSARWRAALAVASSASFCATLEHLSRICVGRSDRKARHRVAEARWCSVASRRLFLHPPSPPSDSSRRIMGVSSERVTSPRGDEKVRRGPLGGAPASSVMLTDLSPAMTPPSPLYPLTSSDLRQSPSSL